MTKPIELYIRAESGLPCAGAVDPVQKNQAFALQRRL